jgi:hypothetical protein
MAGPGRSELAFCSRDWPAGDPGRRGGGPETRHGSPCPRTQGCAQGMSRPESLPRPGDDEPGVPHLSTGGLVLIRCTLSSEGTR